MSTFTRALSLWLPVAFFATQGLSIAINANADQLNLNPYSVLLGNGSMTFAPPASTATPALMPGSPSVPIVSSAKPTDWGSDRISCRPGWVFGPGGGCIALATNRYRLHILCATCVGDGMGDRNGDGVLTELEMNIGDLEEGRFQAEFRFHSDADGDRVYRDSNGEHYTRHVRYAVVIDTLTGEVHTDVGVQTYQHWNESNNQLMFRQFTDRPVSE